MYHALNVENISWRLLITCFLLCSGSVQNGPSFQHSFRIVLISVKIAFTLPHYVVVYPRAKIQCKKKKKSYYFFHIYSRTSAGKEQNLCLYVHSSTIQDDGMLQLNICGVSASEKLWEISAAFLYTFLCRKSLLTCPRKPTRNTGKELECPG